MKNYISELFDKLPNSKVNFTTITFYKNYKCRGYFKTLGNNHDFFSEEQLVSKLKECIIAYKNTKDTKLIDKKRKSVDEGSTRCVFSTVMPTQEIEGDYF